MSDPHFALLFICLPILAVGAGVIALIISYAQQKQP